MSVSEGPSCPACGKRAPCNWQDLWPAPARHPRLRPLLSFRGLSSPLRPLPDFVIIGASKSGTTTLYRRVCGHPRVIPAMHKEVFYFTGRNYAAGRFWYKQHFPTALERLGGKITGESTPTYLFHHFAPQRLRAEIPHAKLIVVLRNPVDRAYSEYNMRLQSHREGMTFEDALDCEERRAAGHWDLAARDPSHVPYGALWHSYAGHGIYADALARWHKFFDPSRVLILDTADLGSGGGGGGRALDSAFEFLGLEPHNVGDADYNTLQYPPMAPSTRRRLVDFFRPHNARLYEMLGRRFDWDR